MPMAPIASPLTIFGSHLRFSSSLPHAITYGRDHLRMHHESRAAHSRIREFFDDDHAVEPIRAGTPVFRRHIAAEQAGFSCLAPRLRRNPFLPLPRGVIGTSSSSTKRRTDSLKISWSDVNRVRRISVG